MYAIVGLFICPEVDGKLGPPEPFRQFRVDHPLFMNKDALRHKIKEKEKNESLLIPEFMFSSEDKSEIFFFTTNEPLKQNFTDPENEQPSLQLFLNVIDFEKCLNPEPSSQRAYMPNLYHLPRKQNRVT